MAVSKESFVNQPTIRLLVLLEVFESVSRVFGAVHNGDSELCIRVRGLDFVRDLRPVRSTFVETD